MKPKRSASSATPTCRSPTTAERAIRMAKVKQKVSGGFRTPRYAAGYCRISGYLQSMALQGYNPLTAMDIALNGNAASMVEKPTKNNPNNQGQKQGASSYYICFFTVLFLRSPVIPHMWPNRHHSGAEQRVNIGIREAQFAHDFTGMLSLLRHIAP